MKKEDSKLFLDSIMWMDLIRNEKVLFNFYYCEIFCEKKVVCYKLKNFEKIKTPSQSNKWKKSHVSIFFFFFALIIFLKEFKK